MPRFFTFLAGVLVLVFTTQARPDDTDPEPPKNTVAIILKRYPKDEDAIEKLFMHMLGRKPNAEEVVRMTVFIRQGGKKKRLDAYKEIEWAVKNTKEYVLRQKDKKK